LLARDTHRTPGARRVHGLAQGSSLSSLLMNLALEQFDDTVRAVEFPLVRYSDDMVILADL
jgi:hypothetical protein